MLHLHFDTHLIYLNKCFPIINSKICIIFNKLKVLLLVKFLERGLILSYLMIKVKVFKSIFKDVDIDIKFKLLSDGCKG